MHLSNLDPYLLILAHTVSHLLILLSYIPSQLFDLPLTFILDHLQRAKGTQSIIVYYLPQTAKLI